MIIIAIPVGARGNERLLFELLPDRVLNPMAILFVLLMDAIACGYQLDNGHDCKMHDHQCIVDMGRSESKFRIGILAFDQRVPGIHTS